MKKYIYLFMILLSVVSCSDWLEEEPKSVAAETFYNTESEAAAAVAAPLANLKGYGGLDYFGTALCECFADYAYGRGSWASNSDYIGLDNTNQTRTANIWTKLYTAIRNCNVALDRLPQASQMSEDKINSYIGELRFIRGLTYFYLVRYFGDVPLHVEENMSEYNIGKSSKDVIYELIESDLRFAVNNAPQTPRLAGTPSVNSAKSLLGEVYATLGRYEESKQLLEEVINSGQYSLVTVSSAADFNNVFGPEIVSSTEEIFYIKEYRENGQGNEYVMFCSHPGAMIDGDAMHGSGGWYGVYTTTENQLITDWDVKDFRKDYNLLLFDFGMGDNTYLLTKYHDTNAPGASGAACDYPLIRYPDVLLLYAEMAMRVTGSPTEDAMEKINMVHRRAYGYDPMTSSEVDFKLKDYSTSEKFLELILKERMYEQFNEGKRWFDLIRLGIVKEQIKRIKGLDIQEKHMLFPIPQTEFNYNEALDPSKDQNPGY